MGPFDAPYGYPYGGSPDGVFGGLQKGVHLGPHFDPLFGPLLRSQKGSKCVEIDRFRHHPMTPKCGCRFRQPLSYIRRVILGCPFGDPLFTPFESYWASTPSGEGSPNGPPTCSKQHIARARVIRGVYEWVGLQVPGHPREVLRPPGVPGDPLGPPGSRGLDPSGPPQEGSGGPWSPLRTPSGGV